MPPSVVEKLRMLRSFVGDDFSEKDLSACLRQSGYTVEVAAERILTGQFHPSPLNSKRPASTTPTMSSKKKAKTPRPPVPVTPKTPEASPPASDWLLCERWVSDGVCTQRNGSLQYQEPLVIQGSDASDQMVRFRASRIQGQFPKHLSAFLGILLQRNVVRLSAKALMEERCLPMGAQVAFSVSIWLPNPSQFFSLFDQNASLDSTNKFFPVHKKNTKQHRASADAKAAFALLQWAQNGETYDFGKQDEQSSSSDSKTSSSDDDDDEEQLLSLEEEAAAHDVQEDSGLDLTKPTECQEADEPEHLDCTLRPYQKEALWWMMQRELEHENEESMRQQLQVLRELASVKTSVAHDHPVGIHCDCGPVLVHTAEKAPSVVDNGTCADLNHPLWERRYLCSSDRKHALSFYVQPLFGMALSSPPLPPRPCRGGLLCDAMGLGKTVQVLALILKSKEQQQEDGTTLIVAPLSLLGQWEEELKTKTNLSHRVYYGGDKTAGGFSSVDVVLTTYGTLQSELHSQKQKGISPTEHRTGLISHIWKRVVLDEAHCIKNTATVASRACCLLQAERRWCVSGTIIQNSVEDVYAQLKFLRHEPWHSHAFWSAAITKEEDTDVALDRVRQVLTPIMLRRTKESVDKNGKLIITLPPVETKTIMVEFSPAERQFYDALFSKSLALFEGFIKKGSVSNSWLAIFSLLHRLRQTCDHVALTVKKHIDKDGWESNMSQWKQGNDEEQSKAGSKAGENIDSLFLDDLMKKFQSMQKPDEQSRDSSYALKIARMLNEAVQSKSSLEECAICLDPIDIHKSVVTPCFHIFCQHCLVDVLKSGQNKSDCLLVDGPCPVCNKEIDSSKILSILESDGKIETSYLSNSLAPDKEVEVQNIEDAAARTMLETAVNGSSSSKLTAIMNELDNVWQEDPGSKVLVRLYNSPM
jgi:SNF2 family DNA or RNA helicase